MDSNIREFHGSTDMVSLPCTAGEEGAAKELSSLAKREEGPKIEAFFLPNTPLGHLN
jgi:hypothetical protein